MAWLTKLSLVNKDKCYLKSLSGGHRVAAKVSGQTLECNFVGGYIMTVVGSHQFSQHLPSLMEHNC